MNYSDIETEQYNLARQSLSDKDFTRALNIMEELVKHKPHSSSFRGLYAAIFWDMNDLSSAEEQFKLATQLSPRTERHSLGLFHCLWAQDKKSEAIEEKNRFTRLEDSHEYRLLWEDFGIEVS